MDAEHRDAAEQRGPADGPDAAGRGEPAEHRDMVEVARVAALDQADVLRSRLAGEEIDVMIPGERTTNTLAYMGPAVNPRGVRLLVPADQAGRAREVLASLPSPRPAADDRPEADRYAGSAATLSVFALAVMPLVPFVVYLGVRAILAARREPPGEPRAYRTNLIVAGVLTALSPAVMLSVTLPVLLELLSGF